MKRGRPKLWTPASYVAWLKKQETDEAGAIRLTQPDIARRRRVSVPTVRRTERVLRQQGLLTRQVDRNGKYSTSYIVLHEVMQ
jgi:hypothetical protein